MAIRKRQQRRTGLWCRVALAVSVLVVATSACSLTSDDLDDVSKGSLAEGVDLDGASVAVSGKEFTEQLIMCYITIYALNSAGADATDHCGLVGSNTVRNALTSGQVDLYWEYTGTAWASYLKHTNTIADPQELFQAVKEEDAENGISWLPPASLNNTFALVVKTEKGEELGVSTLSEYAALAKAHPDDASICTASEFAVRNDGLPGLEKHYGFRLPDDDVHQVAQGAIYKLTANGDPCNFGQGTATDGRVLSLGLTVLEDDKSFFPIYNPAPNVRTSVLKDHPEIADVLEPIAQSLDEETITKLNSRVDVDGEQPEDVAKDWLQEMEFIGG